MQATTRTMPSTAMADADTANGERHALDDERRCAHHSLAAISARCAREMAAGRNASSRRVAHWR